MVRPKDGEASRGKYREGEMGERAATPPELKEKLERVQRQGSRQVVVMTKQKGRAAEEADPSYTEQRGKRTQG